MASSKLKTLCIYDVLKKYTDSEHRVSADEICKLLKKEYDIKAERKGIYRDMEALINHGADIQNTTTGYYLGKRDFVPAEIRLLVSAVQSASFITPSKTKRMINALTQNLSIYQKEEIERQKNLGSVKYTNEEIFNNIEAINRAISMRRKITFYYYKKDVSKRDAVQHNGMRYMVSPYAMIWFQDRYYLVCNVDGHDNLTHFRIDRIKGIYCEAVSWRHFSEVSKFKTTFDASKYAASCVNMFGGDIVTVTLRCKNERAPEIYERFGTSIPVKREEGYFTTIVDVAMSDGFLSWIAQYFDSIEIIKPLDVRKQLKEKLFAAYKLYR